MNRLWAFLKGFRTIAINTALALAAVAPYLAGYDWTQVVDPKYAPLVVLVVNVANILLRFVTTTPVFRQEGEF